MSSEIIKKEGNKIELKVIVTKEEFKKGISEAFQKNKTKFQIPGFRRGKAPRQVIEQRYGKEVFYEEAINIAFPKAYEKALDAHNIDPVDQPTIDIDGEISSNDDLTFKAIVEIMPEVEIKDYKGIEVSKEEISVEDSEVDARINQDREANGRLITIEDRPVKDGDIVKLDFTGFIDEEKFEGGEAKDYELTIGSKQFIPGFEEQLIGMNLNEEKAIEVTFPEDYNKEELKGKIAKFEVKINDIKEKELPELDDEFAKDVSEFDTLDEYKEDIKKNILKEKEAQGKREIENKILDVIVNSMDVEIPEAVVNRQIDMMIRDFDMQLRYQGMDINKYFEMTGTTEESLKEQMKEDAEKRVKTQIAIEEIGKKENIEVSEEDYEKEIEKMAEQYKQDIKKIKDNLGEREEENIKDSIKSRKTVEFLVENSNVK